MPWTDIAASQAGMIARRQLLAEQVAPSKIDRMLRTGTLLASGFAGVYRVAGAPVVASSSAWAAALGSGSPLSYLSAARWWDIPVQPDGLVHITRWSRQRLRWPAHVKVHRVRLDPGSVTTLRGMPVTTRPESVFDCLGWLGPVAARILADRAVQQGWITPASLQSRLRDQPRRWGNTRLREILAILQESGGAAAESERRLIEILKCADITGWIANCAVVIHGNRYVLDIAFPDLKLAIEVDGYAYHSSDERFQADRSKQNALMVAGWTVLRFTWADVIERPMEVRRRVQEVLVLRRRMR